MEAGKFGLSLCSPWKEDKFGEQLYSLLQLSDSTLDCKFQDSMD